MQHSVGVQIHGHPRRMNPEDRSLHRACSHQCQSTPGNPAELVHAATVQGQAAKECHFGRGVASVAVPDQKVGSIRYEENNRSFPLCSQPWNRQGTGSETLPKMSHLPGKRFPHPVARDTKYRCAFSHDPGAWTAHFLVSDWRNRTHLPAKAGWQRHIPALLALVAAVPASPMPSWAHLAACHVSMSPASHPHPRRASSARPAVRAQRSRGKS